MFDRLMIGLAIFAIWGLQTLIFVIAFGGAAQFALTLLGQFVLGNPQ